MNKYDELREIILSQSIVSVHCSKLSRNEPYFIGDRYSWNEQFETDLFNSGINSDIASLREKIGNLLNFLKEKFSKESNKIQKVKLAVIESNVHLTKVMEIIISFREESKALMYILQFADTLPENSISN
ncbi:hypothetical protein ABEF79_15970 [Acinetobacter sp. ANC 7454]|uniref:hypothetical protein n=1 Tax=Acinetobacter thermotolerans TaxID=3151487 RepID=UPI00325A5694